MKNKDHVDIGIIGLGPRGRELLRILLGIEGFEVRAVCDSSLEKASEGARIVAECRPYLPTVYQDHSLLLKCADIEAVLVATPQITHARISCEAMRAGLNVGMEVGGAASLDECWDLVRTSEDTKRSCMLLENVCYGERELTLLHMTRLGIFGELIHLQSGYEHDLRRHLLCENQGKNRRLLNYIHRNADLYPTHSIGPIAKLLRINCGNRFLSLSSVSSKARGMREWIHEHLGDDGEYSDIDFLQGDVVTTMIRCAHGETVLLVHDTTLPRPYSRNGRVQGTNGLWMEEGNVIHIAGKACESPRHEPEADPVWEAFDEYRMQYRHPLLIEDALHGRNETPGSADRRTLEAWLESLLLNGPPSIDVYDAAAWMAITCLSEQSISSGGMPVPFPDFTNGRWMSRMPDIGNRFSLE
jgi:hypothetical protein